MSKSYSREEVVMPAALLRRYPEIIEWSIITAYRGSISHGLYVPNKESCSIDDKDIMSICIPPLSCYFGLREYGSRGTKEIKYREWDIVVYEFKKCIGLLRQGNPNILCILWMEPDDYLKVSPEGARLINARSLFVGRHVYHSFAGYARGQLHRMTHGGAYNGHASAKRKELVQKYGYDCKNAAHLIRLLRMGIEFLKDGELSVLREDASQLLEIKRGEWSLEQVQKEAEHGFKLSEQAYINSTLPKAPDLTAINSLCVEIVRMSL